MNFLHAICRVIEYIHLLLINELGLFATQEPTQVPNPKAVEGSGVSKLWGQTPILKHLAGGQMDTVVLV